MKVRLASRSLRRLFHLHRLLQVGTITIASFLLSSCTTLTINVTTSRPIRAKHVARIGIINAMGMEQAPILAVMHVTSVKVIDGYRFFLGTIDGHPVVDVRSGEKEYAAEFATTIMDTHFHIIASLLTGTAGSRNPVVNVGDVVVGGFVVDKSSIHFHNRGFNTAYKGVEMLATRHSKTAGSIVGGQGTVGPTPSNAKSYGNGPSTASKHYVYFQALAASRPLAQLATANPKYLGTTPRSTATGNNAATGSIPATIDVGVIGSANQWTEPLALQESQNALYQSDAGENEGAAFAYTNSQFGVPWSIIRGISDSPWYPNAYAGVLAADRAATVAEHVIAQITGPVSNAPVTMSMLSAQMNARRAGYIVAQRVFITPAGTVTSVKYTNVAGITVTSPWSLSNEYKPTAGTAGG